MKKSESSSANYRRLPVSVRFHTLMLERIAQSCRAVGSPELYDEAVDAIGEYLRNRVVPDAGCRAEIMLIFTLLRPEIDKAMERSAAARRRKSAKYAEPRKAETNITETDHITARNESESQPSVRDSAVAGASDPNHEDGPCLNRSQRRLIRQELRRAGRKRNKPLQMH